MAVSYPKFNFAQKVQNDSKPRIPLFVHQKRLPRAHQVLPPNGNNATDSLLAIRSRGGAELLIIKPPINCIRMQSPVWPRCGCNRLDKYQHWRFFLMQLGWFNFQYTWVINFVMRKRICSFVGFLSRGRLGVHVEPFEFFSVHVRGYGRLTEEGAGDEEDRPLVVRLLMKP